MKISKEIREALSEVANGYDMYVLCNRAEEILNKPKLNGLRKKWVEHVKEFEPYLMHSTEFVQDFLANKVEFPEIIGGMAREFYIGDWNYSLNRQSLGFLTRFRQNCEEGKYESS